MTSASNPPTPFIAEALKSLFAQESLVDRCVSSSPFIKHIGPRLEPHIKRLGVEAIAHVLLMDAMTRGSEPLGPTAKRFLERVREQSPGFRMVR